MGAWGEGPLDSDQALDWLGNTIDRLVLRLDEIVNGFDQLEENWGSDHRGVERYGHELRAAGYLVCALADADIFIEDHPIGFNVYLTLADRLAKIESSGWAEEWSDPVAVTTALKAEIVRLTACYEKSKPVTTN